MIPAFDAAVLDQLSKDLSSRTAALKFVVNFESLLPHRISRIKHALNGQVRKEIILALLSLKTSAATAGAPQLHRSAIYALQHKIVEQIPQELFIRRLEAQADLFKEAFASFHTLSIPAQLVPPRKNETPEGSDHF